MSTNLKQLEETIRKYKRLKEVEEKLKKFLSCDGDTQINVSAEKIGELQVDAELYRDAHRMMLDYQIAPEIQILERRIAQAAFAMNPKGSDEGVKDTKTAKARAPAMTTYGS